ncbi:Gfo/Idh/MocA family protein [Lichenifustis flavocetrariae]|uniref:Gfo/Idh/MocA family oxidoreductase n=1 Tax=Lichenifustis flavocetrariae TaxID=2949735 RepID=A0AA41Z2I7_9HYPH|nr:Gfo/Idh/MocA family oxidoreductase [Lichenifustis flavocetrariae]MCW6511797.1 Gfo/Idh/MocA family oxidoreductase [Lichenifustis flavocetrariae]
MASELKVGIIGINTTGGWASEAHVPAVKAIKGMTLAAVATSRQETADEAANAFGAEKAYAGGLALIADPDIDIVTVATRVPDHRELLLASIAAGKHVYSEWPLGAGATEAREIAGAARSVGVKHAIGLQLRESPAVKKARGILGSGALGRLLSVTAFSTTAGFGPDVPPQFVYLEDPASFANMITIQGAHTLDLLIALGGQLEFMNALVSRQFSNIQVGEPRQSRARVTFDHLLMHGRFGSGAPFGLEVAGGRTVDTPFHLEVTGEKGSLRLDGGAPRGVQSSRIGLSQDGERQSVDEGEFAGLSDGALNVAGVYEALGEDIRNGSSNVADFHHAVRLTRLIEDVLETSEQGARVTGGHTWPDR